MPEEFDSDAGTPENRLAISRKARELLGVERMVEALGAGEMAHDQRDAVIAGIDPGDDALRFRDRQAEPVHAGVDMNGGAAGPAGAAAKHVPFGEFVEIADHGLAVDLGEGVAAVLEEAVEHIDRRRRHRGADDARFLQRGDEKRLAAGAGQRACDRLGAAAIGVGLDHAGAFGRHRRSSPACASWRRWRRDRRSARRWRWRARRPGWPRARAGCLRGIDFGSETMFMPHFTRRAGAVQPRGRVCSRSVPANGLSCARSLKRVNWPSNCSSTVPVGPWRCLPMMTSALPCASDHVELPLLVFGRADPRFLVGEVIFLAVHEHHDVGVLLDRAGFTQVGQLRALVVAAFDLTRQLRQRDDRER